MKTIANGIEIGERVGERVPEEAFRPNAFPTLIDSRATRVVAHGRVPRSGNSIGEHGEHSPILESLESVRDDDRRTSVECRAGADIHEEIAEDAREDVFSECWCCH